MHAHADSVYFPSFQSSPDIWRRVLLFLLFLFWVWKGLNWMAWWFLMLEKDEMADGDVDVNVCGAATFLY